MPVVTVDLFQPLKETEIVDRWEWRQVGAEEIDGVLHPNNMYVPAQEITHELRGCTEEWMRSWCTSKLIREYEVAFSSLDQEEIAYCMESYDDGCGVNTVEYPLEDGYLQARACTTIDCSNWSNHFAVPEPSFPIGVLVCVAGLLIWEAMRKVNNEPHSYQQRY